MQRVAQLAVDIRTDRERLEGLGGLCGRLLEQGDDVDLASLCGPVRAEMRRLEETQSRHDVTVCIVKFRPSTTSTDQRPAALGKLVIFDDGTRQ